MQIHLLLPFFSHFCTVALAKNSLNVIFALNIGGPLVVDNNGIEYQADSKKTQLPKFLRAPVGIYESGWFMDKSLQIPIPVEGTGLYKLTVNHMSDNYGQTTAFKVKVNDGLTMRVPAISGKSFVPQKNAIEFSICGGMLLADANMSNIVGDRVDLEFSSEQGAINILNVLVLTKRSIEIELINKEYRKLCDGGNLSNSYEFLLMLTVAVIDLLVTLNSIIYINSLTKLTFDNLYNL
jgi:hypothetical protein